MNLQTRINVPSQPTQSLPDYRSLTLNRRERLLSAAIGIAAAFLASYLFYRSVIMALLLCSAGLIAPRLYRAALLNKRRERIKLQFKEALFSLTSSLAAGRSVENAFKTVPSDLRFLYPDPNAEIVREFDIIRFRLENGEPLEQSLRSFSDRTGIEDITHFVDVFCVGKRSGGDLVEVIRQTSQMIGEKLDIQLEISVMIAQKRFESRIMMGVPFLFLAFLGFAAPDYMEPLYDGIGYVLLTVALLLLAGCYWFIYKLMDIKT
ncbi:type II secretion system F family protein [Paenibacillus tarimensis]